MDSSATADELYKEQCCLSGKEGYSAKVQGINEEYCVKNTSSEAPPCCAGCAETSIEGAEDINEDDLPSLEEDDESPEVSCEAGCCQVVSEPQKTSTPAKTPCCSDCNEESIELPVGTKEVPLTTQDVAQERSCQTGCCAPDPRMFKMMPASNSYLRHDTEQLDIKKAPTVQHSCAEAVCQTGCCQTTKERDAMVEPKASCCSDCDDEDDDGKQQIANDRTVTAPILEGPESACQGGCCGAPAIPKETDACLKGCCESSARSGCGGSYSVDMNVQIGAHEISICCEMCWHGSCCHLGCCVLKCCIESRYLRSAAARPSRRYYLWKKLLQVPSLMKRRKSRSTEAPLLSSSAGQADLGDKLVHTVNLEVGGMTCTDCSTLLNEKLSKTVGVISAQSVFMTRRCLVSYDPALIDVERLRGIIRTLGFTADLLPEEGSGSLRFFVDNPSTNVVRLAEQIKTIVGVISSTANVADQSITVNFSHAAIGPRSLLDSVYELGQMVHVVSTQEGQNAESPETAKWRRSLAASAIFGIPVLLISYVFPLAESTHKAFSAEVARGISVGVLLCWILCTPIQFGVGFSLYSSAYKSLRYGHKLTMDALIMLSTSIAYFYSLVSISLAMAGRISQGESFFETTAMLLMLIMLGRYLEAFSKGKAAKNVSSLIDKQTPVATLVTSKGDQNIDVLLIQRGDILKIVPGARVPTDGIIVSGSTMLDESIITGESLQIPKTLGGEVIGGSVNGNGSILVRVTNLPNESTVANIATLIQEAQASRAPVERISDVISSRFTVFVIVLALLVFVIWISLAGSHAVNTKGASAIAFALQFTLAVLVISCPCAFGLAVPTAVMVASGVGTRYGVLFKGGAAIENLQRLTTIVFDKTGTLTIGKPQVTDVHVWDKSIQNKEFLSLVGSAESGSEHVIGKAIADYCRADALLSSEINFASPQDFEASPGQGISCTVNGIVVRIGTREWLASSQLPEGARQIMDELESRGKTSVCVEVSGKIVGAMGLLDTLKPEALSVINQIRARGLQVQILSGDNQRAAEEIALQLGIDSSQVIGGALPRGKLDHLRMLLARGEVVAMIGDGINDAPALATADVGIAIGAGSQIALDAADIVLVNDDLRSVLIALDISRRTFLRIKLNFAWAILYNMIGVPLAAGAFYTLGRVYIPLSVAGLSELFSSVPVIVSSLLLRLYKPPPHLRTITSVHKFN